MAVSEEADRLLWCPDAPLRRGWPAQDRGTGGVVGEAVLGEGYLAAAGGELAGGEGGDVPVPELVELEGAEAGNQVIVA